MDADRYFLPKVDGCRQVVTAALLIFLCVAIFNVKSCPREGSSKDCNYNGRTIKHATSFHTSSTPCYKYICNNRKISISYEKCWWNSKCYTRGQLVRFEKKVYQCSQTVGDNVAFKPAEVKQTPQIDWKVGPDFQFPKKIGT
ncbi:hypothetical protein PoB_001984500 [Plakobranchus ocellatus]|uniref:Uncharacterized protein n=1 Tax=Plakobranchus ocellatus TaxID=259542 RepID=A0AAV3ZFH7_9GAST|nr:hypothetical protein PoB_001984500 [Plakobranchus ocellatus]